MMLWIESHRHDNWETRPLVVRYDEHRDATVINTRRPITSPIISAASRLGIIKKAIEEMQRSFEGYWSNAAYFKRLLMQCSVCASCIVQHTACNKTCCFFVNFTCYSCRGAVGSLFQQSRHSALINNTTIINNTFRCIGLGSRSVVAVT